MKSPQKTARMAGLLYLILAPLGIMGLIYVSATMVVDGDAAATINNILANESMYRLSIFAALITQVVNVFVVLFLYKVLQPVNKNIAALMVIFILLGAPIAMLSEAFRYAVLLLVDHAETVTSLSGVQLETAVSVSLDLYETGIMIATIFWGLWLFPMGYLVFKSGYIPKLIGILLMIGCFGYLADVVVFFFFPESGLAISQYTFIGEILLPLWLLIKGVNVERLEQWTIKPAF